ncbi:MAG: TetR/AcrR family transcriptional regulator [Polyangiaceae bacterium]
MGTNERRERERNATRAKILDAARELFLEHGFEAVTMRKVADKIEYTPTAIYFHFKDKEALLRELCINDFSALAAKFMKIGKEADPVERLKKAGQAYAEFGITHPNHYRLMFMSEVKHVAGIEEVNEMKGNPESDAYAFLRWTVGEAFEQDRLRPEHEDPELVSQLIWAAMHGIVSLEIAKGKDTWITWRPIKDRVRGMIELVLHGVVKEEAPAKRARSKKGEA